MFVYERGNSLNLTFKNMPVENPEVVIDGYENGAEMSVNRKKVVSVDGAKEFDGKAKTLVYQKDDKLMITFHGVEGMKNPEVTLDETTKGTVDFVVNGTPITVVYDDESVDVSSSVTPASEPAQEQPHQEDPQPSEPEQPTEDPDLDEGEPEPSDE